MDIEEAHLARTSARDFVPLQLGSKSSQPDSYLPRDNHRLSKVQLYLRELRLQSAASKFRGTGRGDQT